MGKYVRVRDANWKISYTGGWCLQYVRQAFGIGAKQPTATAAWNASNKKHYDLPPLGMTVPVFFSLNGEPAGHVAIRLDDGYVASSTQSGTHPKGYLHKNLDDLIAVYAKYYSPVKYLGWTEDLNDYEIVRYEPEITTKDIKVDTPIAFTSSETKTDTLPLGEKTVSVAGKNGTRTVTTRITYSDGKETGRQVILDTSVPPVNEVILVGTFVKPVETKPEVPQQPPKESDSTVPGLTPDESFIALKQIIRQIILAIIGWIKQIK